MISPPAVSLPVVHRLSRVCVGLSVCVTEWVCVVVFGWVHWQELSVVVVEVDDGRQKVLFLQLLS